MPTEAVVFPAGDDECLDAWCGVAGMLVRRQVSRSPARWTQAHSPVLGPLGVPPPHARRPLGRRP